ncbi:hypothetical protein BD410DRAFT_780342 [Rickenella mellea]|uniref:F-box domain-containing protein n=1 Tax=Rickenella mellea TaxID=50990 RepID=A0A4R5XFH1_9AGAM|nr:hypothetical protein BD410DRAFT_780342 [Rickenella mellea]
MSILDLLPVELIAVILSELDLKSLITVSYLSRRLHRVVSDATLNPWRGPISRNLSSGTYEECLRSLSVRSIVPRQNWVDILSTARFDFLLFEATLPNLPESTWEQCFKRRFLPGWMKWKKEGKWREVFSKMLIRLWHRTTTFCTVEEAWTKYIVLNRNGSANLLEGSSRTFNPLAIFNEMKLQNNLAHLETSIRLVVQLVDVRILAFGVLTKPRGSFLVNKNARAFLRPPGAITQSSDADSLYDIDGSRRTSLQSSIHFELSTSAMGDYSTLTHPQPMPSHSNYPMYTPGGGDMRWLGSRELEDQGRQWVGGLMLTAQLTTAQTRIPSTEGPELQDLDLVIGPGRGQYASLTWADLSAIAPWMEEHLLKKIDGPGLGN